LAKDILSGPTGSSLDWLINVNGTLFFAANDGTHGNELWKVVPFVPTDFIYLPIVMKNT